MLCYATKYCLFPNYADATIAVVALLVPVSKISHGDQEEEKKKRFRPRHDNMYKFNCIENCVRGLLFEAMKERKAVRIFRKHKKSKHAPPNSP